ncbi:MAG: TatD family hydrolase [Candidatus Pacebacteria bacterium]|nr:TatD family hydrolase [Candidatus Paceibacterota bacterium]
MNTIDIHAHTNFAAYDSDRDEVIARAKESGVAMINIGTQYDTSKKSVEMSYQYDTCYAIIGLHPIHTTVTHHDQDELGEGNKEFSSCGEIFDAGKYRELAQSSDRVVGIGECGFDYYRNDHDTKQIQEIAFRDQIQLAIELDLPLMLHVRPSQGTYDAYMDVLDVLSEYKKTVGEKLRGDVHFFAGTIDIAQQFMDLGFDISFTGVITFAKPYEELVRFVPLDRIHGETDCPYVSPAPHRGQRNEPLYVLEVVKKIAEIKGENLETVQNALMQNAKRLFGINL